LVGDNVADDFRPEFESEQCFRHFGRREKIGQFGHGCRENVTHLGQVDLYNKIKTFDELVTKSAELSRPINKLVISTKS